MHPSDGGPKHGENAPPEQPDDERGSLQGSTPSGGRDGQETWRHHRSARQQSQQSVLSQAQSVSSLASASDLWDKSLSVCSSSSSLQSQDGSTPVLPGAYHQSAQPQQPGYGYMHQTSMSSVRSQQSPPSVTMRVYRALYDYAAQDHDEVSFRDGDVIVNAQPIDEGWMYGTVQRTGKSGMLPANYVECFN
ncbi:unnamed protein product [Oncorhynchus mykiss]|uniref:SH3 domain-containing protein n=1 Tax=Oncorhynchus mykiss TaxID=8022 RepID=A0A060WJI5_ONCMY|nr:unnamed protein product [Oncorhynchus mykiss]